MARDFRTFRAIAAPEGDAVYGIPGPLVRLEQFEPDGRGGAELRRVLWLKPDEATALGAQIRFALAGLGGVKPVPAPEPEFA